MITFIFNCILAFCCLMCFCSSLLLNFLNRSKSIILLPWTLDQNDWTRVQHAYERPRCFFFLLTGSISGLRTCDLPGPSDGREVVESHTPGTFDVMLLFDNLGVCVRVCVCLSECLSACLSECLSTSGCFCVVTYLITYLSVWVCAFLATNADMRFPLIICVSVRVCFIVRVQVMMTWRREMMTACACGCGCGCECWLRGFGVRRIESNQLCSVLFFKVSRQISLPLINLSRQLPNMNDTMHCTITSTH